jgi:hypothetical protein
MEKDIILSNERVIFMIELEKYRMELDSIQKIIDELRASL